MSIKEKIGQRIKQQRLSMGLTRKQLSELTGTLKATSINNYERGDRTPGPEEIQQLAVVLQVSPAFLMCLTDENSEHTKSTGLLVPILDYKQASKAIFHLQQIKKEPYSTNHVMIHPELAKCISQNAFALQVKDESMLPEFRIQDCIIIDPDVLPVPGDYVAVKLAEANEIIIRKFRQISLTNATSEFELIALNPDWATIKIMSTTQGEIIGTVINLTRIIKY